MTNNETPVGKRFSFLYLERGKPVQDSERFRKRLSMFAIKTLEDYQSRFYELTALELGVTIDQKSYEPYFSAFFERSELRDLLDAITLIRHELVRRKRKDLADRWVYFVERVFDEENLGYRVDDGGGVHYFIDEEFERSRVAALHCLANPKYAAVAAAFDDAHRNLDEDPADTKGAVRAVFEAMETLAKLMVEGNKISRLGPNAVERHIRPIVQGTYEDERVALDAANQLLTGLSDWINSAQLYRHGQKVKEPAEPPLGLTVAIVSSGATYLRWLVELDQRANQ